MTKKEHEARKFRAKKLIESNRVNHNAIEEAVNSAQKNRERIKLRSAP